MEAKLFTIQKYESFACIRGQDIWPGFSWRLPPRFDDGFFPNDLSLGFSNSQLRAHLESDRRPQTPCPLVERWWPAGGTMLPDLTSPKMDGILRW